MTPADRRSLLFGLLGGLLIFVVVPGVSWALDEMGLREPLNLTATMTGTSADFSGTVTAATVKANVLDGGTLVATGPATVTGAAALGSTLSVVGKSTLAGVNAGDVVLDGGARLLFNAGTTHIESDGFGGVQGAFGAGANFTGGFGTTGGVTVGGTLNAQTSLINSATGAACTSYTGAVCVNDAAGLAVANGSGATVAAITATGSIRTSDTTTAACVTTDGAGNADAGIVSGSICVCSGKTAANNVCNPVGAVLNINNSSATSTVCYHCFPAP